jgi:hypothetical protein
MMGRFVTADSIVSDIYDPQDLNRYAYARNNPMKYVDPDGHAADTVWDLINIGMGIASFAYNVKTGNVSGAIVDAVGIVSDSAAAVVPFLPGGVATGIKAYRAADTAADALKTARTGSAAVEQTAKAGSKVAVGEAEAVAKNGTEVVQRAMSRAELEATRETCLLRGGREGTHHVSDAVNTTAKRARERLGLPKEPEVRVTMEVPVGNLSPPSRVQPFEVQPGKVLPGGGMERTATGDILVKILDVREY